MGDRKLLERTFDFAVRVIRFLKTIPYSKENEVIRYQLARCATSVGANYEESQASSSKEDFAYKIGVVVREARESNYWLRILKACKIADGRDLLMRLWIMEGGRKYYVEKTAVRSG